MFYVRRIKEILAKTIKYYLNHTFTRMRKK